MKVQEAWRKVKWVDEKVYEALWFVSEFIGWMPILIAVFVFGWYLG